MHALHAAQGRAAVFLLDGVVGEACLHDRPLGLADQALGSGEVELAAHMCVRQHPVEAGQDRGDGGGAEELRRTECGEVL